MTSEAMKNYGYKSEIIGRPKIGKSLTYFKAINLIEDGKGQTKETKYLLDEQYISPVERGWIFDFDVRAHKHYTNISSKRLKYHPFFIPDSKRLAQFDPIKMLSLFWKMLIAIYDRYDSGIIIIDTATKFADVVRKYIQYLLFLKGGKSLKYGRMEEVIQLMPSDYQVRNDIMNFLYGFMNISSLHFGFTTELVEKWDVVKDPTGDSRLQPTGEWIPKRHSGLPYAVDLSCKYELARKKDSTVYRRMEKETLTWDEKIPVEMAWSAPSYTKIINTISQYSHKKILQKKFGKNVMEEKKIETKKEIHEEKKKIQKEIYDKMKKQKLQHLVSDSNVKIKESVNKAVKKVKNPKPVSKKVKSLNKPVSKSKTSKKPENKKNKSKNFDLNNKENNDLKNDIKKGE